MIFEWKLRRWLKSQRSEIKTEIEKLCWVRAFGWDNWYREMPALIPENPIHAHKKNDTTPCEICYSHLKIVKKIEADNKLYEDLSKKLAVFDTLLGENDER